MPKEITIPEQSTIVLADRRGKPLVSGHDPKKRTIYADQCTCLVVTPRTTTEATFAKAALPDCAECGGTGLKPATFSFLDFCEFVSEDPRFVRTGILGVRTASALARCALEKVAGSAVRFTDSEHALILRVLNEPTEGFELPQGIARLAVSFYEAFESARTI